MESQRFPAEIPISRLATQHSSTEPLTPRTIPLSPRTLRDTDLEGDVYRSETFYGDNTTQRIGDDDEVLKDVEKAESEPESKQSEQQPSEKKDPNLVDWEGPDDPMNPQNWTRNRKLAITIATSMMTLVITFASSVFSTATEATAELYGVSDEVTILGTSLFVLGFAVGPLFWGPLSELYGRTRPLFFGYILMGIFHIPVAAAQNLATILVCRFIAGMFGCAPLAIVGGLLADIWNPVDRGIAICLFAAATFIGPVAGPIAGGFITQSSLGWRWTAWLTLIMDVAFCITGLMFVRETYPPILLSRKAYKMRHETKNWALHAKSEEQKVDFHELVVKYLFRPFQMMIQEPILVLITIYMALVYGILYLFFEAYPIAFSEQRGWSLGVGALPFLGLTVGVLMGGSFIAYVTKTRFARKLKKHGKVIPEERLIPMIVGSVLFPIGLFWFAWTSSPNITPWPQIIAGVPIGAGVLMIFIQGLNYIIDVYLMYANSAIAANTFVRSFAGAGFPLFATGMYHNLGVAWATTILAFLSVAMIPVPILFFFYGKKIRGWSKFSPNL
ncbi:hypothetical protein MMC25_001017 [Agyrium rufum]|nr:hypothetical protein [Agyrium rufum]